MRLVQFWVPDVRSKKFKRQAHLDSLAIANSRLEKDDQAFVDSVSVWPDEESGAAKTDSVLRVD